MECDAIKLAFCAVLTFCGLGLHLWLRGRPDEFDLLRRLIVATLVARLGSIIALHTLAPHIVQFSDALLFYMPQSQRVLQGQLPYLDFSSSYSFLFPYLMAPGFRLWPGVGGAALTMFVAEFGICTIWLRIARHRREDLAASRAVFLWLCSPLTWYWTALMGYNSVLIAMSAVAALAAVERRRPWLAVLLGALGLWAVKLLSLLAWPAVAWQVREGRARRLVLLAVAGVAYGSMPLLGIDTWRPLVIEAGCWSGGNVWAVAAMICPSCFEGSLVDYGSFVLLGVTCVLVVRRHLESPRSSGGFTSGCALTAALFLLYMMLAKKTYPMYEAMYLPCLLHALSSGDRLDRWALGALAVLGLTATTQMSHLWLGTIIQVGQRVYVEWWYALVFQGVRIGAHAVLLVRMWGLIGETSPVSGPRPLELRMSGTVSRI